MKSGLIVLFLFLISVNMISSVPFLTNVLRPVQYHSSGGVFDRRNRQQSGCCVPYRPGCCIPYIQTVAYPLNYFPDNGNINGNKTETIELPPNNLNSIREITQCDQSIETEAFTIIDKSLKNISQKLKVFLKINHFTISIFNTANNITSVVDSESFINIKRPVPIKMINADTKCIIINKHWEKYYTICLFNKHDASVVFRSIMFIYNNCKGNKNGNINGYGTKKMRCLRKLWMKHKRNNLLD